jgi:hypothetical protein
MKKYTSIVQTDKDLANTVRFINSIKEYPVKVTVEKYVKDRSLAQNKLLHMWLAEINDKAHEVTGKAYGAESWKIFFKSIFLGYRIIEVPYYMDKSSFKKPTSDTVDQLISTKDLTTKEFTIFLEKIDHFAIENLELQLPHPDDLFYEAMGR